MRAAHPNRPWLAWNETTSSQFFYYSDAAGARHQVWLDDARSWRLRLEALRYAWWGGVALLVPECAYNASATAPDGQDLWEAAEVTGPVQCLGGCFNGSLRAPPPADPGPAFFYGNPSTCSA